MRVKTHDPATDLSLNGLGLLTEHDIPMNALLTVNLESVAGEELLLPIRVRYVMQMMSMTYRIGGTFEFMSQHAASSERFAQARLFGD